MILDKGGLDALMEPGAGAKLGIKYLNEVYRWIYAEFGWSFLVVVMDTSVDPNGNAIFLVICMTEQASFAGQESYEIRREVCVPYPCRIPCFRLFSVNSPLLFSFSYLVFIVLLYIFLISSFDSFFCLNFVLKHSTRLLSFLFSCKCFY